MEQTDEFSILKQPCDIHQKARISFVSISPDTKNLLSCSVCQVANKNNDTVISLEEILMNDETTPISNWPPEIDPDTFDFIKNKQTTLLKETIQEGITIFYDGLKSEINQLLLDSQKAQLMELDQIQIGSDELISIYNELFKRQELLEIFSNKKIVDLDKYQNLLNSLKETSKNDFQEISEKIQEKKKMEIQFRRFQKQEITQLLDKIFYKINELNPILYSQSQKNLQLESFDYGIYFTVSEADNQIQKLKSNLMNIQKQLNKFEHKSIWMFSEQSLFQVNYSFNEIINVSNPSKNTGIIETFYKYHFGKSVSFKIKFSTFASLDNFSFFLVTDSEQRMIFTTELFNSIKSYFKNQKFTFFSLQLQIRIQDNEIQVESDSFNQSENISHLQKDESYFKIKFQLNQNCEEFQLSEYKFL